MKVGSFTVVRRLGVGGMGLVMLAVGADGRPVAVKMVREELADEPQFRRRFAREVEALSAVGGSCTANLVVADVTGRPQWVAMEYVPGLTLADYVDHHGRLPASQVRLLGWALAQALFDIHSADLIHRDLKPSNVILSPTGPRVIDFGVAPG